MKTIHLNAMNLDVIVWDLFSFHDDGEVESLLEHDKKLCKEYDTSFFEHEGHYKGGGSYQIFSVDRLKNKSIEPQQKKLLHAHVYIKTGLGNNESIFLKAHEEGHILLETGLNNQFYNYIECCGYNSTNLPKNDNEIIVSVGGLCAVERINPTSSMIVLKGLNLPYVHHASHWMELNNKK